MSGGSGTSSSEDEFYDNKEKDLFSTAGVRETRVSEKTGVCVLVDVRHIQCSIYIVDGN